MNVHLLSILFGFFSLNLLAQNSTYYVNASASGAANGTTWADAFTDLHDALNLAQSGDQVWVAQGTYVPDEGIDRDRYFELKSGVKLYGGFAGFESSIEQRQIEAHPVLLSGNIGDSADSTDNSYTILYLPNPDTNTLVNGFVFQHGYALNDTNFMTNVPTSSGGAVYIKAQGGIGMPTFDYCVFRDNSARFNGGAVYVNGQNTQGSTPLFRHCEFYNNKARLGGAVYLYGGSPYDRGMEFEVCRFEQNFASFQGGAIYLRNELGNEVTNFSFCKVASNDCLSLGAFVSFFKTQNNPIVIEIDGCELVNNGSNSPVLIDLYPLTFAPYKFKFELTNSKILNNDVSGGFVNHSLFNFDVLDLEPTDSIIIKNNIILNNKGKSFIFYPYTSTTTFEMSGNVIIDYIEHFGAFGKSILCQNNFLSVPNFYLSYFNAGIDNQSFFLCSNNVFKNHLLSNFLKIGYNESIFENLSIDSISINNNLFSGVKTTVYSFDSSSDTLNELHFTNNIFQNEGEVEIFKIDTTAANLQIHFSHNLSSLPCSSITHPNFICGPGNIVSDNPMFINSDSLDFRLSPCSPAVDAGFNAAAIGIPTDLGGAPRIQGGAVDIGPYEAAAFGFAASPQIKAACQEASGGSVSIAPDHGCEPYTYTWNPSVGNGPELSGLPPGDYQVTVTDSRGRSFSDTLQVPLAPSPQINGIATDVVCGTLLGGTATVAINSGTPPFAFEWSTGAADSLLTMLPPGQYKVTVTDAQGCIDSTHMFVFLNGQLTLIVDGQPISCFGEADGELSAQAANGKAPFTYAWSNAEQDSVLTSLEPGQYIVTVTDFYGCTAFFSFHLDEPPLLLAFASAQPTNSEQTPNGSALAGAGGGTPPHTYAWSTGEATPQIQNLSAGIYTVTVTDVHDCTATTTVEVLLVVRTVDPQKTTTVKVWPNPAREWLYVETDTDADGRFLLYDALGRLVVLAEVHGGTASLDVSKLPAGVYEWRCAGSAGKVVLNE